MICVKKHRDSNDYDDDETKKYKVGKCDLIYYS